MENGIHDIPGAVLCVVEGDKIVYLKAYGNKEIVPDTVQMTVNTVFDLASLSKCVGTTLSFMALLAASLISVGKIEIDDLSCLAKSYPDFRNQLAGCIVDPNFKLPE